MNSPTFPPFKLLLFDWGDTLMRDFRDKDGPMCFWDHIEVIEGVEEVLSVCYETYPMMVASNSGFSTTDMVVKALFRGGIDKYFSHFFTSKDIGCEKPDPRFFRHIIEHTRLEPAQMAFIGNDYRKDIEAAKNAGMHTFFFNENNLQDSFEAADFTFNHFSQLLPVLMTQW